MIAVEFSLKYYSRKSQIIHLYIENIYVWCQFWKIWVRCIITNQIKKCEKIWEWCIQRDIWFIPAYDYKSLQNKAGQPSKKNYTQRELKLNSDILQKALIKHSL